MTFILIATSLILIGVLLYDNWSLRKNINDHYQEMAEIRAWLNSFERMQDSVVKKKKEVEFRLQAYDNVVEEYNDGKLSNESFIYRVVEIERNAPYRV